LVAAESYGICKTHAAGHNEHWRKWQAEDNCFSFIAGDVILPPPSELNQPGSS
jgi:hypothetical protein